MIDFSISAWCSDSSFFETIEVTIVLAFDGISRADEEESEFADSVEPVDWVGIDWIFLIYWSVFASPWVEHWHNQVKFWFLV